MVFAAGRTHFARKNTRQVFRQLIMKKEINSKINIGREQQTLVA